MKEKIDLGFRFIFLILFIVVASIISGRLWSAKDEKIEAPAALSINETMTIAQIAKANNLENIVMKKAFDLQSKEDLQKKLSDAGLSVEEAVSRINMFKALQAEDASKNWVKIVMKFVLWFAFLLLIYVLMRKKKITAANRTWLYFIAVLVFGIILGADPSQMGTIKDNFSLFGAYHVLFPPRIVAFVVMLLMVILANKFICSWGCQLGTL